LSARGRILVVVDVQLRHVNADRPAGLARVDVLIDGQVVADADWRACTACGVAVLEQVRTDPDYRGHGYARQAVHAARVWAPRCSWSTTTVAAEARSVLGCDRRLDRHRHAGTAHTWPAAGGAGLTALTKMRTGRDWSRSQWLPPEPV
jgi:GNAT superfamily N-acetyltransferase